MLATHQIRSLLGKLTILAFVKLTPDDTYRHYKIQKDSGMGILYFLILRPLCILQMSASLLPNSFIHSFNKFLNTYSVRGMVLNTKSINQFSSVIQSCPTLCNPMNCRMPGLPVHYQLPESTQSMSIVLVMPSNHLICHPLLLLPTIFPSIRVFSNESALCNRWPKYQSFSFNISPSNEQPGLISFRMDWLDLLAGQ